jgi:hypothetical protein
LFEDAALLWEQMEDAEMIFLFRDFTWTVTWGGFFVRGLTQ